MMGSGSADHIDQVVTVSPAPDWSGFVDTKVRLDVLRYLQADGWEVKKQTFYNHCNDGKLTVNQNGLYTKRLVKKYAETWLVRTATGKTIAEEGDDLAAQKTRAEISRIRTAQEREQLKLDVERGKYILRSDVEAQLAGRAVMFDNGLTHLFQSAVPDMIALVKGDQRLAADLLSFLMDKKDALLNEYATMDQIQVVFEES